MNASYYYYMIHVINLHKEESDHKVVVEGESYNTRVSISQYLVKKNAQKPVFPVGNLAYHIQ